MTTESNVLLKLLSNIREDGAFSDLEVRCESSRFQVHRCIVCPQSIFFDRVMKSQFQEAESKEIVIYDDPFIIAKMFDFIYRADYDDSVQMSLGDVTHPQVTQQQNRVETEQAPATAELGDCDDSRPLLPPNGTSTHTNAKVYVVADKYVIEELKNLSRKKLESRLKSQWSDTEFIPFIEYVYGPASPPKSDLRQVISTFAVQHLSTLKSSEDFHEVRRQYPDFAHDFSTIMMERIMQLEEQLRGKQSNVLLEPSRVASITSHQSRSRLNQGGAYCCECNRSFVNMRGLRQHDTDFHGWCTDCKQNYSTVHKAKAHRSKYHGGF